MRRNICESNRPKIPYIFRQLSILVDVGLGTCSRSMFRRNAQWNNQGNNVAIIKSLRFSARYLRLVENSIELYLYSTENVRLLKKFPNWFDSIWNYASLHHNYSGICISRENQWTRELFVKYKQNPFYFLVQPFFWVSIACKCCNLTFCGIRQYDMSGL